jgi:hypothetical protein
MGKFSHLFIALVLALPLLMGSCTVLPFGGVPTINSFTASPTTISEGSSSELGWSVSNATALIVDQGIGSISAAGSSTVTPAVTTTYTLTAVNAAGAITKTVTVTVNSASLTTTVPVMPVPSGLLPPANPPGNKDWLASTYTQEYHWPSCSIAQNIPPPSRRWFDTVNQAQANGFHPCPVCRPPR